MCICTFVSILSLSLGLLSWLPTYYSERFDVPLSALSSFTALPYFLQLGAALGAGGENDRRGGYIAVVVLMIVDVPCMNVCMCRRF